MNYTVLITIGTFNGLTQSRANWRADGDFSQVFDKSLQYAY